jgi:hypothetical protein
LGSGMVKGIGPVYAKKLVATFGEGIFDIIEKGSARLEDIDDIEQPQKSLPAFAPLPAQVKRCCCHPRGRLGRDAILVAASTETTKSRSPKDGRTV